MEEIPICRVNNDRVSLHLEYQSPLTKNTTLKHSNVTHKQHTSTEKKDSQTLIRALNLSSNAHNESSYLSPHHGRIQECK